MDNELEKYMKLLCDYQAVHCTNENNMNKSDNCCDNEKLVLDQQMNRNICRNCGQVGEIPDEVNFVHTLRNPKYRMSTRMGYSIKYSKLHRIHKWNNYDYKENAANANYIDITLIGNKLHLSNLMIKDACNLYCKIYIGEEVSSRDKIKTCMYIYCLYRSAIHYGIEFDLFDILKKEKLSIDNFNKATDKLDNKLLLNKDMPEIIKIANKNYNKNLNTYKVIIKYNEIVAKLRIINKRLNKNTALLISIFQLLETKNRKKFVGLFDISGTTLLKFIKKLK